MFEHADIGVLKHSTDSQHPPLHAPSEAGNIGVGCCCGRILVLRLLVLLLARLLVVLVRLLLVVLMVLMARLLMLVMALHSLLVPFLALAAPTFIFRHSLQSPPPPPLLHRIIQHDGALHTI